ncbi:MAG: hypothetical protein IKE95_07755 [Methanobrevibacter sp.]|nr:hypothetical protein [Methanobrevibacter sp.]
MTIDVFQSYIKAIVIMLIVFLITQTIVFIVSSYFVSGDAFLALRNFYNMNYNIGC